MMYSSFTKTKTQLSNVLMYALMLLFVTGCSFADKHRIDLSGEWRVSLDPDGKGMDEAWYNRELTEKIQLPGTLQGQGFGNDVSTSTQWTGQVVDSAWYTSPRYAKYREEGNIKVPFWLNPIKHYVGAAWYQRDIEIPKEWEGKAVELKLERCHWESSLFLDGKPIGSNDALSTPHYYTLVGLASGKHTLTVRIDNSERIKVGSNAHSISDHTQSNWNGIVGELSLTAKSYVCLGEIQLFPDVEKRTIQARITFKGRSMSPGTLILEVQTLDGKQIGEPISCPVEGITDQAITNLVLPLGDEVELWSEFTPTVYQLKVTLETADEKEERIETFGMREFKANGTRFEVNGTPIFLRGTLECCIFPLTGHPSMEATYWAKIYRTVKEFGLNHVRFHSWCPPKVAFQVADTMGVYLQAECAAWATIGDGQQVDEWVIAEGERILREYGNHPSFCMLSYGNEPGGANQSAYLSRLVDQWKERDNRRVYNGAAGWPHLPNADYWNAPNPRIQGWGEELRSIINAQPPRSNYDFVASIDKTMPTVSHEIGQWCAYPNFAEIDKYTGVLKAKNFEIFRETLRQNHLGDMAENFLFASGRLQTLCYKADIEAALRTKDFAGFQLLDLHDFPGQGTALVGVLDAFWDTKGYVDGAEYAQFCNSLVPLVRLPKMVYLNNETLDATVEVANFSGKAMENATVVWQLHDGNNEVGKGEYTTTLPIANGIGVGEIHFPLDKIGKATQLTLTASIAHTSARNSWNIWVYPSVQTPVTNAPLLTTTFDSQAIDALNNGKNVLLTLPRGAIRSDKGGDIDVGFSSIFWNTAWTRGQKPHTLGIWCDPSHKALAEFPTACHSDYQWWDMMSACDAMVLDDFPASFRPVVYIIDDWFTNHRLGMVIEAKVGNGKLVVCSADLTGDLTNRPAAAQLKQSLSAYMSTEDFSPSETLTVEHIRGLLK